MHLKDHLLYVDVTSRCGIGCGFCMYADIQNGSDLRLNARAAQNLARLINSPTTERITLSGEGEPLNNIMTIRQILDLSTGGNTFELITSGFWNERKLLPLFESLESQASRNGDNYNIRISTDEYHAARIKHRPQSTAMRYLAESCPTAVTFSFRSVWKNREWVRAYLLDIATEAGLDGAIEDRSPLEDALIIPDNELQITYKNFVNPRPGERDGVLDMASYMEAISHMKGKPFTFGHLTPGARDNGMDITIKPNGDVFFYGIEVKPFANIFSGTISPSSLKRTIERTPVLRTLYTVPFEQILSEVVNLNEENRLRIRSVNNPYWIVKVLNTADPQTLGEVIGTHDRLARP